MKWINVKESLPEDGQHILFWDDCECVCLGWFKLPMQFNEQLRFGSHVTHWMPLPEPPKY